MDLPITPSAMHCKDVLGKIYSNGNNSYKFSFQKALMKILTSPSWHAVAVDRSPQWLRRNQDGQASFIR